MKLSYQVIKLWNKDNKANRGLLGRSTGRALHRHCRGQASSPVHAPIVHRVD